jgi:hypothetical protein
MTDITRINEYVRRTCVVVASYPKENYRLDLHLKQETNSFWHSKFFAPKPLRKYPHFVKVSFVCENIDSAESQVNGTLAYVMGTPRRPALLLLFGRLGLVTKAHRPIHYLFA